MYYCAYYYYWRITFVGRNPEEGLESRLTWRDDIINSTDVEIYEKVKRIAEDKVDGKS